MALIYWLCTTQTFTDWTSSCLSRVYTITLMPLDLLQELEMQHKELSAVLQEVFPIYNTIADDKYLL